MIDEQMDASDAPVHVAVAKISCNTEPPKYRY
jgi:hypothetical protein